MFNVTQPVMFLFQAAISALQKQPIVNAVIDGDDIIYRDYVDISIAVGTPKARCPHFTSYFKIFTWRQKFEIFNEVHSLHMSIS